jgi:biopolymer transport protein ExbB
MLELIQKSGICGYLIILCSVFSLTFIIERFIVFKKVRIKDPEILLKIINALRNGTINSMSQELKQSNSPVVKVVYEIVSRHVFDTGCCSRSRESIEKTINYVGEREVRDMEKHLPALLTIGQLSPLLGLLGTVIGMIKAFMVIQQFGGKVNAQVLAGGIWEAMLTTAMGLAVAIPTMLAYSYFTSRLNRIVGLMNDIGNELIEAFEKAGYFHHHGQH